MLGALARHSFLVILLAIVVEELGVPLPIPTDVLIVFTGAGVNGSVPRFGLYFVMLVAASTIGASGLYVIIRHGGRPLVERFGRYVHLGPKQLARSEALLASGGWGAIALGRATPGVRYATVVACGLFKVPYPRFVLGHVAGTSVYVAAFLGLGAVFGSTVLEWVHLPELGLHLLWLLLLAVGLPLLMVWWGSRAHPRQPAHPSGRRRVGSVLLGSFAGTVALAATWAVTATMARALGVDHPLNVAYALLSLLLPGLESGDVSGFSLPSYAILLVLFVGIGTAYYEFILPRLAPRGVSLRRQALGLALLALDLFAVIFSPALLASHGERFGLWWQTGGPIVLVGLVLGVGAYVLTAVYGRTLAIATVPTLRRK